MSKVLIKNSTLTNIAEAIRDHGQGNTSLMKPSEMPEYIANIDTEKVTIDDYKVTEKMNLYTYLHTMDFKLDTEPTNLKFPQKKGQSEDGVGSRLSLLPDESVLEYPIQPANGWSTGSSNPTVTNFTDKFNLYKKDGTKLTINTPNYTIPTTSQNGTLSENRVEWNSITIQNHLGDIYVIIEREFMQNRNSSNKQGQSYVSVWKLNITSTGMSWTQKCLEIPLTDTSLPLGPPEAYCSRHYIYIDDNDLIILGSRNGSYGPCIYMLHFGETIFSNIPLGDLNDYTSTSVGSFLTRLNNTIYCYIKNSQSNILKAWEIDYNTKAITKTLDLTTEFQNIAVNVYKTGFIKNNKLYFTYLNITDSTFTTYEFNPINWSFITKTVINGVNDYQLFMNCVPQYVNSDTQIWYFNTNSHLETTGPYMLPELIDWPSNIPSNMIVVTYMQKRHYFLPNQEYILTYVKTTFNDPYVDYSNAFYDYRVYIRRLDNKPLTYTTLQL